jgi:hypothetical protein
VDIVTSVPRTGFGVGTTGMDEETGPLARAAIAPEPEGDLGIASAAAIFGPLICLGVAALDPQRVPREAGEIGEGLS